MNKKAKEQYRLFASNFEKKFNAWRKENKGGQEYFAELIDVADRKTVSNYINAVNYPSPETMELICSVLDTTEEELNGGAHDERYKYDEHFTKELHLTFQQYADSIGLSSDFMRFVKSAVSDSEFPVYSPIVSTATEPKHHRQPLAEAFPCKDSNEFQCSIKGGTVNLGYADYQFLHEVQEEVIDYVRYLYFKRKKEMESEVCRVQSASTEKVNGVTVYDSLPIDEMKKYDPYLQFITEDSVSSLVKEGESHGKEN